MITFLRHGGLSASLKVAQDDIHLIQWSTYQPCAQFRAVTGQGQKASPLASAWKPSFASPAPAKTIRRDASLLGSTISFSD